LRHDPIDGKLRHHNGIDIAMPEGSPVKAAKEGKVIFSGLLSGYGNTVIVEHGNGLTSLYAHNSLNLVKEGDVVDKNSILALSGSSGRSTGPHLHFEVRKDGVAVDPMGQIEVIG
jgi:murein DD-endopeptidase MepM/ murein hydrolase activator NlpD